MGAPPSGTLGGMSEGAEGLGPQHGGTVCFLYVVCPQSPLRLGTLTVPAHMVTNLPQLPYSSLGIL